MDDAAGRTAAESREALEALIYDWGDAYLIGCDGPGGWWAARRDRVGALLTAPGPGELRAAIRADYAACPVSCDLPGGDAG